MNSTTTAASGVSAERWRDAIDRSDEQVSHHEWIYGPNCGLVDIELSKTGRPDITREFFVLFFFVRDSYIHRTDQIDHLEITDQIDNLTYLIDQIDQIPT